MLQEGLRKLELRAKFAYVAIAVMIVGSLLGIAAELIEAGGIAIVDDGSSTSLTLTLMYLTEGVGLLVSIIAVAMWIHRAHANLYEAGAEGLQFTPGWAVG